MKKHILLLCLALIGMIGVASLAQAQGGNITNVIATDARFTAFNGAVQTAGLTDLYNGNGPYTIFAPTNAALSALGSGTLQDGNAIRQTLLHHTLQGQYNSQALWGMSSARTALGRDISITQDNGILINGSVKVVTFDIPAANGVIHVIDTALSLGGDSGATFFEGGGETTEGENNSPAGPPPEDYTPLFQPESNPAFVSGGHMPHWTGIHSDSHYCKGTTWVLMKQMDGVTYVGSDRKTNPYRGDTNCATPLPILCINQDYSQPPSSQYQDGWAHGRVRITAPVDGYAMTSPEQADQLCANSFDGGWRMARFHDGAMGMMPGYTSGWNFWAYGGLPIGMRFWVRVEDQPANPWNSENPRIAPPNLGGGTAIFVEGADPAFVGSGYMSYDEAVASGNSGCYGMTWVIHKQLNGLVEVGADGSSNPYFGDRPCGDRYPVLCIRVDGFAPPANSHDWDYSSGWSGGWVKQSNAVSGHEIDTRAKANAVCANTFGQAWKMAGFHDGNLGTGGTDGWDFWAYGTLTTGLRFWVAVHDQAANPWNP